MRHPHDSVESCAMTDGGCGRPRIGLRCDVDWSAGDQPAMQLLDETEGTEQSTDGSNCSQVTMT